MPACLMLVFRINHRIHRLKDTTSPFVVAEKCVTATTVNEAAIGVGHANTAMRVQHASKKGIRPSDVMHNPSTMHHSRLTAIQGLQKPSKPASLHMPPQVQENPLPRTKLNLPTPINVSILESYLTHYRTVDKAVLIDGFTRGFKLHYEGQRKSLVSNNLPSFNDNMVVGRQKVQAEINLGRMAGPFSVKPFKYIRSSPLGLCPKKTPGKFRLIHHLSYPHGDSVNSHIPDKYTHVKYAHFDTAVALVRDAGRGAQMSKCDIKDAFRLLPLAPSEYELVGFIIDGQWYYDKTMPQGCSISAREFERFSTCLQWIIEQTSSGGTVTHYLDDFFFVGRSNTDCCLHILKQFQSICSLIGVPLAPDKTVNPCYEITYLGLQINSLTQQVVAPFDKVQDAISKIHIIINQDFTTLRSLQSIIGTLSFLNKPIPAGRAFLRRLIDATVGHVSPHDSIHVSPEVRADLSMWLEFLQNHNGVSVFQDAIWTTDYEFDLYTDASGTIGWGAYLHGKWCQGRWPHVWLQYSIAFKEIFPIMVACAVFRDEFKNKRILLHTDNMSVLAIVNTKTSKCPLIMRIVRKLVLDCLINNMSIKACYINTKCNSISDALSRFQTARFRQLAPTADTDPVPVPPSVLTL